MKEYFKEQINNNKPVDNPTLYFLEQTGDEDNISEMNLEIKSFKYNDIDYIFKDYKFVRYITNSNSYSVFKKKK